MGGSVVCGGNMGFSTPVADLFSIGEDKKTATLNQQIDVTRKDNAGDTYVCRDEAGRKVGFAIPTKDYDGWWLPRFSGLNRVFAGTKGQTFQVKFTPTDSVEQADTRDVSPTSKSMVSASLNKELDEIFFNKFSEGSSDYFFGQQARLLIGCSKDRLKVAWGDQKAETACPSDEVGFIDRAVKSFQDGEISKEELKKILLSVLEKTKAQESICKGQTETRVSEASSRANETANQTTTAIIDGLTTGFGSLYSGFVKEFYNPVISKLNEVVTKKILTE